MGGKPSGPTSTSSSFSRQQIGEDPLSQALSRALGGSIGAGGRISDAQKAGQQTLAGAGDAFGLTGSSVDALRGVIEGNFLNSDTLGAEIEAASAPALREFRRSIAPSIASSFATSGRTGSGAERAAFSDAADGVSRNIAEIASGKISEERGRQTAAAGLLPQLIGAQTNLGQAQVQTGDPALDRILKIAGTLPALRTTTEQSQSSEPAEGGGGGKGGSIGTVAGAGLGGYFGGIDGAKLGGAIGGTVGGSI